MKGEASSSSFTQGLTLFEQKDKKAGDKKIIILGTQHTDLNLETLLPTLFTTLLPKEDWVIALEYEKIATSKFYDGRIDELKKNLNESDLVSKYKFISQDFETLVNTTQNVSYEKTLSKKLSNFFNKESGKLSQEFLRLLNYWRICRANRAALNLDDDICRVGIDTQQIVDAVKQQSTAGQSQAVLQLEELREDEMTKKILAIDSKNILVIVGMAHTIPLVEKLKANKKDVTGIVLYPSQQGILFEREDTGSRDAILKKCQESQITVLDTCDTKTQDVLADVFKSSSPRLQ